MSSIPVIDLFAGPGGLNEGFSRLGEDDDEPVFETIGSFEMESSACSTLELRGAYRFLRRNGGVPASYYQFIRGEISLEEFKSAPEVAAAFESSKAHVHQIELGVDRSESDELIAQALKSAGVSSSGADWALIGGPPCQAYSLAGRSRRANDETFAEDKKHFLYREYLHIIRTFEPPIFVMENVKGLLSSTTAGSSMFDLIKADLERPKDGLEYAIHSLVVDAEPSKLAPTDFIIRSEEYGIPQKRHRVILLGIRRDYLPVGSKIGALLKSDQVTVGDALAGLPALRSGISPASADSLDAWNGLRKEISLQYAGAHSGATRDGALTRGAKAVKITERPDTSHPYKKWIADPELSYAIQHQSRSHMPDDLRRYWFAANRAAADQVSPKLRDFPEDLLPNHKNATSEARPFEDRFRVQVDSKPSTTVVSHISKDGHYYIHPDASQMRSLTVREAARLQTFPDNYFFMGNRTQQYHQVGNAVPPLLANQIARIVADIFLEAKRTKLSGS